MMEPSEGLNDGLFTRKTAILVNLCILLAAALVLNRSALPHGWLPEYRVSNSDTVNALKNYKSNDLFANVNDEVIRLTNKDTLFVGDSVTRRCPADAADVISLPGTTAESLSMRFADALTGRHYERIVLWPGNAHFHHGGNTDDYVTNLVAMVENAQAHADSVVVITPVPWRKVPRIRQLERLNQLVPSTTWWATRQAKKALSAPQFASVAVFNGSAYRSERILDGSFYRLFEDRFHPNRIGTLALFDAIDDMTHPPMARGPVSPRIIGAVTGA